MKVRPAKPLFGALPVYDVDENFLPHSPGSTYEAGQDSIDKGGRENTILSLLPFWRTYFYVANRGIHYKTGVMLEARQRRRRSQQRATRHHQS